MAKKHTAQCACGAVKFEFDTDPTFIAVCHCLDCKRAIVMDPKLLFCDEPSAGLDPVVSSAIDDLILRLRDAMGMTIVVVTHELESAFKIADRIIVLDKGEIIAMGTVDEIRANPNERVQNLLNRRTEEVELDPEAYLDRLMGEEGAA